MSWRERIWKRWTKITGAYQAYDTGRSLAYIDRRDLCQNLNQLEGNVTDFRRAVKQRTYELETAINRSRDRVVELTEAKLKVQRESLMDARQENQKLRDKVSALTDKVDLMAKRLERAETSKIEKIGG